jgi:PIN domain
MEYLLIDLENIAPDTLSGWPIEWPIYLFVGEKQSKMKTDLVQSLLPRGEKVRLIQVNGEGKNALDFHIAFYLGKLSSSHSGATFKVLSGDKGFDPLVKHLKQLKVDCERIEKLPAKSAPTKAAPKKPASAKNQDWPALQKEFATHLKSIAEGKRPKKMGTLKAYFKSHCSVEQDVKAEEMIDYLLKQNRIQVESNKIRYLG